MRRTLCLLICLGFACCAVGQDKPATNPGIDFVTFKGVTPDFERLSLRLDSMGDGLVDTQDSDLMAYMVMHSYNTLGIFVNAGGHDLRFEIGDITTYQRSDLGDLYIADLVTYDPGPMVTVTRRRMTDVQTDPPEEYVWYDAAWTYQAAFFWFATGERTRISVVDMVTQGVEEAVADNEDYVPRKYEESASKSQGQGG